MNIKVAELKGYKSLRALNAFSALVLGVKMLPAYMAESYEDFLSRVHLMDEEGREKIFKEAAHFVKLEEEEIEALLAFALDPNGVPFGRENMKNLGPDKIVDIIVAVSLEIARMKIDFLTDNEKKN